MYTSETWVSSKLALCSFFDMPGVWVYLHDLLQTNMNKHCLTLSESGASLHWHGGCMAGDLGSQPACLDGDRCHLPPKEGRETLDLLWGKVFAARSWFWEGLVVPDTMRSGGLSGGRLHLSYGNCGGREGKRQQRELLSVTYWLKRLQRAARNRQTSALPKRAS